MKKRGLILICMFLLLPGIVYAITTSNPKPTIKVKFYEEVTILKYNLTYLDTGEDIKLKYEGFKTVTGPPTYYAHNFTPTNNLLEGVYNFSVKAEDLAGNIKTSSLNFSVKFEPLVIDIKEPSYGVSNQGRVNITINTSRSVVCKYRISSFTTPPAYDQMNDFAYSNGFEHKYYNYDLTEQKYLHAKCQEQTTGKEYYNLFTLIFDNTKPVITNIEIIPERITEGTAPFIFNVTVDTNEPTTCKYGLQGVYNEMEDSFLGDMTYKHNASIAVFEDGKVYRYNVSCIDRAGLVSETQQFSFVVDTSLESDIILISPMDWVSTSTVTFTVRTIKRSICSYSNGSDQYTSFGSQDYVYEHSKSFSMPEGSHNYNVKCIYSKREGGAWVDAEIIESFEIKVDRTKPTKPEVNDTSDISNYPELSPFLDRLKASFKAYDGLSGIKEFVYNVINSSNNGVIANGTADKGNCGDGWCINTFYIEDLELENNTKYKVKAKAKDNAGLESLEETSDGVTVDTSKKIDDTTEPGGWITKNITKNAVIIALNCRDSGTHASGCNDDLMKYDTAITEAGCNLQSYTGAVTLTSDRWFCWQVGDYAGNLKTGSEFINITKETTIDSDGDSVTDFEDNCVNKKNPDQRNSDNDEFGDACDNCPRKTNSNQADSDGDDAGDDCDECPDTSSGKSVDENGCSSDQRKLDSDYDGMPDFWERMYGLDPYDADDATLDSDNDGFTNLEEYEAGTDPKNPNSIPRKDDADNDGVIDSKDKCPRTPAGESVDSDGCSSAQKLMDSDGDGMPDSWEELYGLDPNDPNDAALDSDNEGLSNLDEYSYGTNPTAEDSDGDGFSDKKEIDKGTDPLDPNSYPSSNFLSILLLVLGILILLGGAGFLVYTQIIKKGGFVLPGLFKPKKPFMPKPRFPPRPARPIKPIIPIKPPVSKPKAVQEKIAKRREEKKEERKKFIEEVTKPKKSDVFKELEKITAEEEKGQTFKKLAELSKKKK